MTARVAGAALVLCAVAGATGRFVDAGLVCAVVVWLAVVMRRPRASARLVIAVALLARLPFLFADYQSDDLYRYLWEGRIQHAGFSPFAYAPDHEALAHLRDERHAHINHPGMETIYPPLTQGAFFAAAGAGLDERQLRNAIVLLDCVFVCLLVAWLRGRALVYAWSPIAVASVGVGHIEPLMLLCLAGCLWAWSRERAYLAAALLGCAVLAKTVAVLLLPWFLLRRPKAVLVAFAPVVLLGYAPYLPQGNVLGSLPAFGAKFAFNAALFRVIDSPLVVAALLGAWVLIVAATQPRLPAATALVLAGLLLLSPTVHYWYLTWLLVPLAVIGPRVWATPLLVWCATVLLSFGTYRGLYADGSFVENFGRTALEYALPGVVALFLVWRHWPRRAALAPSGPAANVTFGVIVPSRGERANLAELLPRWRATQATRIVVADTPTGDGTRELCGDDYLEVPGRGYGNAVAEGLAVLRGTCDVAIVCDADHALGPEQAGALLAPFADPNVGLVSVAREGRLGMAQRLGNALTTFLIALGWGRRFHDLGPFRALRLDMWPEDALRDRAFGWNVEMNVRALERGMGVVEVGLPTAPRPHGRDRISGTWAGIFGAGAGMLRQLYRLREESCRQPS